MVNPRMTKEDREWRARMDAETLVRAQEITTDAGRMNAARVQAKKMAAAAEAQANKARAVAGRAKRGK